MNIPLLDNITIEILKQFGWREERKVDVSSWIEQLTAEGFECFPYAVEVLEELGGLEINPKQSDFGKSTSGDIDFHALDAGSGEFDRLEIFEPIAKEKLFPLGMVFAQWFLYVGFSKKVYMGNYVELYMLGENIEECLNNIFLGDKEPVALHKI